MKKLHYIALGALIAILTGAPSKGEEEPRKAKFGEWSIECEKDKMSDEKICSISHELSGKNNSGRITGYHSVTIMHPYGVAFVVGRPDPIMAQIRVDKNPAAQCTGISCQFKDKGAIAKQAAAGKKMLLQITSITGVFEYDASLAGYNDAIKIAAEWGYPVAK